ncbi:MAG: cache domain-containing protein [Candidatus Omnitrophota bacterium]
MKTRSLRATILWGFFAIIMFMIVSMGILGVYIINKNVYERTQSQLKHDIEVARTVFNGEINLIKEDFALIKEWEGLEILKGRMGLDYLYVVTPENEKEIKSEIVSRAFSGQAAGGVRIIDKEELSGMNIAPEGKFDLALTDTPKARPTDRKVLDSIMSIEYAEPFIGSNGKVEKVLCGGKIINKTYALVDKIHDLVFGNVMYKNKPLGTVTIFQDDVRISTNVLNKNGKRAVGTRVSEAVYNNVVKKGISWFDRAFVVTDWYITGYEPIRNINGEIIGILYVGILEKPFNDLTRNTLMVFMALALVAVILSVFVSVILSGGIAKPLTGFLSGTDKISSGDLEYRIKSHTPVRELNKIAFSFNNMAARLGESYKELRVSNEKLDSLNKSYLDLIGFVSHELKGILASTILNAYSVRDGFLGMVNFKQQKALDSITRNLDYLESTVKNFLGLSRIEKGELSVREAELFLKEDIFDSAVETFSKQITEGGFTVVNKIRPDIKVMADRDLLLIVANNLVNNAIKYGQEKGKIIIDSVLNDSFARVSVYNDGRPITDAESARLFKRFSRLEVPGAKKVKGTGLGLFITKEIIEKHGGTIKVEPAEKGNSFIFTIKRGTTNDNTAS